MQGGQHHATLLFAVCRSNLARSYPESLEFVSSDLSMILQLQKFYPRLTQVCVYCLYYSLNYDLLSNKNHKHLKLFARYSNTSLNAFADMSYLYLRDNLQLRVALWNFTHDVSNLLIRLETRFCCKYEKYEYLLFGDRKQTYMQKQ